MKYLNYRFAEEEFSTSYIPNRNVAVGSQFQGMWCGAWQTVGIDYKTDFDWGKEQLDFINCYNFSPAFIVYATSALWNKYWSYRPTNSFVDEFRAGGDACGISKDVYPSASDPYIIGLEFCHTTAKFTSFKFKNRLWDGSRTAKDIEILGSKDGVNFVSLIKYTNTQFTEGGTYTIDIPTNKQDWYKSYRFKTTSSNYGAGWVTFGYITPVGKWKSYKIQNLPLFEKGNLNLKSPVDGSDISAPIIINGKTVYAAYGTSINKWASPINCKIKGRDYTDNKIPVYLKYTKWEQPILKSDTDYGIVTASAYSAEGYNPYRVLDGITSGGSGWWETPNHTTGWWKWDIPQTIKIKGIKVYARGYNNASITARFYTSSDMTTPIGNSFSTSGAVWASTDISGIPSEGILTNCIYCNITGGSPYCGIGEIVLDAYELTDSGTPSDYDKIEYLHHNLLDWQITDGSYTFTGAGTFTFTIPRGVHTIYVTCGSSSSSEYSQSIYGNGQFWADIGRYYWSDGESSGYSTYGESHYVEVSPGKTYTIKINSSSMSSYPTISWSKTINNTAYTKDGRID